jgi:phosphate transport system protein
MTRNAFHQELGAIEEGVIQIANQVEQATDDAVLALHQGNSALAFKVISYERAMRAAQRSIQERCLTSIVLQSPFACDFRALVVRLRVSHELVLIGSHAVGVARQVISLEDRGHPAIPPVLGKLAGLAWQQVHEGLRAFVERDTQQARGLPSLEEAQEVIYRQALNDLLELVAQDGHYPETTTTLVYVANELRQIGECVTTIGEQTVYLVTGEMPPLA